MYQIVLADEKQKLVIGYEAHQLCDMGDLVKYISELFDNTPIVIQQDKRNPSYNQITVNVEITNQDMGFHLFRKIETHIRRKDHQMAKCLRLVQCNKEPVTEKDYISAIIPYINKSVSNTIASMITPVDVNSLPSHLQREIKIVINGNINIGNSNIGNANIGNGTFINNTSENANINMTDTDRLKQMRIIAAKEYVNQNIPTGALRGPYYTKYSEYIKERNGNPLSVQKFNALVKSMGYIEKKSGSMRTWSVLL